MAFLTLILLSRTLGVTLFDVYEPHLTLDLLQALQE